MDHGQPLMNEPRSGGFHAALFRCRSEVHAELQGSLATEHRLSRTEYASLSHFARFPITIEGTVSREDLFQLVHAKAKHKRLQAMASERDMYPDEFEATNTAGQKTSAITRKAIVAVYPVPLDF
ncbi:MAG: hypothetical protein ACRD9L_06040 [Bryobacteraceae bacterium]